MDSLRNSRRISGRRSDNRKCVCCSQANVWTVRQKKGPLLGRWPLAEVRLWTCAVFPTQGCNRLKYLDVSWNQLSHTRDQLGITRKHVITLTHLDTRNNPWQKVNTLVTYRQIDHSTILCDMSRLYTGIFCENCSGRDPWRVKWGLHFLNQGLRRNLTPVYSNVCEAAPIGNLSTRRSWFTNDMAGGAELDRARYLRAKCKSLSKPTWNHHERWQNNSFLSNICVNPEFEPLVSTRELAFWSLWPQLKNVLTSAVVVVLQQ